jgi:PIN domain nuclease of toxin-antitoxin system
LATPGLVLVPLTPEIAIDSSRLPASFHGDPADRIILATAKRMGARHVTRDRKMLD